jgi:DNA invertase Pin-like site-specific DNA recombinase
MRTFGYSRTDADNPQLSEAGVTRVYADTEMRGLFTAVRPGDVVVIASLDRFMLDTDVLIDIAAALDQRGVSTRTLPCPGHRRSGPPWVTRSAC